MSDLKKPPNPYSLHDGRSYIWHSGMMRAWAVWTDEAERGADNMLADLESYVSNCHGVNLDRERPDWHHGLSHESEQLLDVWRSLLKMRGDNHE